LTGTPRERAAIAGALALSAAYACSFLPFLSDDALISLRYAQRLLDGQGLTWTAGPRVEGYSNLAWVLLVAGLGRLGVDLIDACRGLGLALSLLTALAMAWGADDIANTGGPGARRLILRVAPMLCFGLSATTAAWAVGGLEQPLVGACLAWAWLGLLKLATSARPTAAQAASTGTALALLCLTRPDSPLFVLCACLSMALAGWHTQRRIAWPALAVLGGLSLLTSAAQTWWRHGYYGEWVSNTALVKAHLSAHHAWGGLVYVASGAWSMWPLLLLAAACARALHRRGQHAALLVLVPPCALWLSYVALVGGDIFPAFRHFTPVVLGLSLLVACGLPQACEDWARRWGPRAPIAIVTAALLTLVAMQSVAPEVKRARAERWEWDCKDLATTLRSGFGPQAPLMAVTVAGCLPYWTGYPAIDTLGLNDHHLPRHPPSNFGDGLLAHELGSGSYVMARRPDLVIFQVGAYDDRLPTGLDLMRDPDFHARYTPMTVHVHGQAPGPAPGGFNATIWVGRFSPLLGIRQGPHTTTIPAHLIGGNPLSRLHADDPGSAAGFAVAVTPEQPAWVDVPASCTPRSPALRAEDIAVATDAPVSASLQPQPDGALRVTLRTTRPLALVSQLTWPTPAGPLSAASCGPLRDAK
jgi:arabinofuranosyltransferase